jgi:hypothetical protein
MNVRVFAAQVVVLLSAVGANASTQYTVTDLGHWLPSAINNSGLVCGNQTGNGPAILYSSGGTIALGTLAGWPYANAYAINDSGQVAGRSGVSNNEACSWSGTVAQDLGVQGEGTSINNSGQIVGNYSNGGAWLYSGGTLQTISPSLGPGWSINGAAAINSGGQILLNANNVGSFSGVYVLTNGTAEALNVGGPGCAMNDVGEFAGYDNGTQKAFSGNIFGPTVSELPTLPGYPYGKALALNNGGLAVGDYSDPAYGFLPTNAALWDNGQIYDLNTLIQDPGWRLAKATGINNSGQICGYGINSSGQEEAFLLTPVPEPSTLVLFSAAGFALVWHGQRRLGQQPADQSGAKSSGWDAIKAF